MALILENKAISSDIYSMTLDLPYCIKPGQFVELHMPDDTALLLPRPISIFDRDDGKIALVYKVVGKGTALLSSMNKGQNIDVTGPLGNGFPLFDEEVTLIGGGLGIAPLYYLAKALNKSNSHRPIHIALGYSEQVFLKHEFESICGDVRIDIGGYITNEVDFSNAGIYYACGPAPMLKAAAKKAADNNKKIYVSLEARMGCGVGACFGCSIATTNGNKRVCKDGPVFLGEEVVW